MKKEKEYPASWQRFHDMVSGHSSSTLQSKNLTSLVIAAGCTTRLPVVYKKLGLIKFMGDYWYYARSDMQPSQWQALVRAKMKELVAGEKRRNERNARCASANSAAASLSEEIEAQKVDFSKFDLYQYKGDGAQKIKSADAWIATDEELVHELRRRGYEVTARKIVEL